MRAWWILAVLLCAALIGREYAHASWFGSDDDEEDGTERLSGRTLDEIIAVLGYPDSSVQLSNKTVYVWNRRELFSQEQRIPSDRPRRLGEPADTITTTTPMQCTFKAILNANNMVIDWGIKGNKGACAYFYRKFLKLPKGPPGA